MEESFAAAGVLDSKPPTHYQTVVVVVCTMASQKKLDPLREFLDAVVTRIETLEAHCGIAVKPDAATSAASSATKMQKTPSVKHLTGAGRCLVFLHDLH